MSALIESSPGARPRVGKRGPVVPAVIVALTVTTSLLPGAWWASLVRPDSRLERDVALMFGISTFGALVAGGVSHSPLARRIAAPFGSAIGILIVGSVLAFLSNVRVVQNESADVLETVLPTLFVTSLTILALPLSILAACVTAFSADRSRPEGRSTDTP